MQTWVEILLAADFGDILSTVSGGIAGRAWPRQQFQHSGMFIEFDGQIRVGEQTAVSIIEASSLQKWSGESQVMVTRPLRDVQGAPISANQRSQAAQTFASWVGKREGLEMVPEMFPHGRVHCAATINNALLASGIRLTILPLSARVTPDAYVYLPGLVQVGPMHNPYGPSPRRPLPYW